MEIARNNVETRSPTKRCGGILEVFVGGAGVGLDDDAGGVDSVGDEPVAHRLGLAVVAGDDNGGGGGDVATGDYQATGEGGAW